MIEEDDMTPSDYPTEEQYRARVLRLLNNLSNQTSTFEGKLDGVVSESNARHASLDKRVTALEVNRVWAPMVISAAALAVALMGLGVALAGFFLRSAAPPERPQTALQWPLPNDR